MKHLTHFQPMFHFYIRKPTVFCFLGVLKWKVGRKWIKSSHAPKRLTTGQMAQTTT